MLGLTPAQASNKRFRTCVVESSGCQEEFMGGSFPQLKIVDTEETKTKYSVCVNEIVGKQCFDSRMNRKGKDLLPYDPRAAGPATARWKVDGKQVGVWRFYIVAP